MWWGGGVERHGGARGESATSASEDTISVTMAVPLMTGEMITSQISNPVYKMADFPSQHQRPSTTNDPHGLPLPSAHTN